MASKIVNPTNIMTSAAKSNEKLVNQKLCNTVLILDALYLVVVFSSFHDLLSEKHLLNQNSLKGIQEKNSLVYSWLTNFSLLFAADVQANPTDLSWKK